MKILEANRRSKSRAVLFLFCCIAASASLGFAQDATPAGQSSAPQTSVPPQQTTPAPQVAPSPQPIPSQTAPQKPPTPSVVQGGGVIHGIVKSGNQPLPGATITA